MNIIRVYSCHFTTYVFMCIRSFKSLWNSNSIFHANLFSAWNSNGGYSYLSCIDQFYIDISSLQVTLIICKFCLTNGKITQRTKNCTLFYQLHLYWFLSLNCYQSLSYAVRKLKQIVFVFSQTALYPLERK